MQVNRNYLTLDKDGREILDEGRELFNFLYCYGDINGYFERTINTHFHKELEVFLLLSGSVLIEAGGERHTLKAGEGCFINSDILHSYQSLDDNGCTYYSFVFDASIIAGMATSIFDTNYVTPLLTTGPEYIFFSSEDKSFSSLFKEIAKIAKEEADEYEFYIRNLLSLLFLEIRKKSRSLPSANRNFKEDSKIKKLLSYIEEHIGEEISIPSLASVVSVSSRECQRIFIRYVHYAPIAYIQKRRIAKVTDLLRDSSKTISEIAYECGFASASYLSKQFKSLTGIAPIEYRKKLKEKETIPL